MVSYLFVPQYIYFYSCLSMETGPAVGGQCCARLCELQPIRSFQQGCTVMLCGSAEAQQAGLAVPGAGWGLPHTSSKAKCVLCPSSDFLRDAQRCWEGGCVIGNAVALVLCVIQVRLELGPSSFYLLLLCRVLLLCKYYKS